MTSDTATEPVLDAAPMFTVFTPTYNRSHTLHRVYDSLHAQTYRNFEWLVIDDGSTDGTAEMIESWRRNADFPIRFFAQPHAGKHVAHNRALDEARGRFFIVLDSDGPPLLLHLAARQ
jgi:glycosyltransferase involved in cell wall biosynthesis